MHKSTEGDDNYWGLNKGEVFKKWSTKFAAKGVSEGELRRIDRKWRELGATPAWRSARTR